MNYKEQMELAMKIKKIKGNNWASWAKDSGVNPNVIHDVEIGVRRFNDNTPMGKAAKPNWIR